MNSAEIIFYALVAGHVILVALILYGLVSDARAGALRDGDWKMIRPSSSILWCGVLMALWAVCGIALLAAEIASGSSDAVAWMIAILLVPTAGSLAVMSFLRYFRHRIRWNDQGMVASTWLGTPRRLDWSALTSVVRHPSSLVVHPSPVILWRRSLAELELRFGEISVKAAPNMVGYAEFRHEMRNLAERRGVPVT